MCHKSNCTVLRKMHPGKLELCNLTISYQVDGKTKWEILVADLRVIGELTNDHGPYLDDYFICFATDSNAWYEASFYADGREEFLKALEVMLGCELRTRLVWSTEYASNILWPLHLAGTEMFSFKPVKPKTWIGRLIGSLQNKQEFTADVLAELRAGGK